MKITAVHTYALSYPVAVPFANSRMWNRARTVSVVEVVTDAGISGWGEATRMPSRRSLDHHVIGKDPFDREPIWNGLNAFGKGDIAAISAVDIALWDIAGKVCNLPISKLLGAFRERIPCYVSSPNFAEFDQLIP